MISIGSCAVVRSRETSRVGEQVGVQALNEVNEIVCLLESRQNDVTVDN